MLHSLLGLLNSTQVDSISAAINSTLNSADLSSYNELIKLFAEKTAEATGISPTLAAQLVFIPGAVATLYYLHSTAPPSRQVNPIQLLAQILNLPVDVPVAAPAPDAEPEAEPEQEMMPQAYFSKFHGTLVDLDTRKLTLEQVKEIGEERFIKKINRLGADVNWYPGLLSAANYYEMNALAERLYDLHHTEKYTAKNLSMKSNNIPLSVALFEKGNVCVDPHQMLTLLDKDVYFQLFDALTDLPSFRSGFGTMLLEASLKKGLNKFAIMFLRKDIPATGINLSAIHWRENQIGAIKILLHQTNVSLEKIELAPKSTNLAKMKPLLKGILEYRDFDTRFAHLFSGCTDTTYDELFEYGMALHNEERSAMAFRVLDSIPVSNRHYSQARSTCAHIVLSELAHEAGESDNDYLTRKYELVTDYLMQAKDKPLLKQFMIDQYRVERGEFKGAPVPTAKVPSA